jgi:hypothetical protein
LLLWLFGAFSRGGGGGRGRGRSREFSPRLEEEDDY